MPTTVNKDIGGGANDYSDPSTWEADTDNNLVTADQVQVGRLYGSHNLNLTIDGATTDSTRYRILQNATGEGLSSSDPGRYDGSLGAAINSSSSYTAAAVYVQENNFILRGIQVSVTSNSNQPYRTDNGTRAEKCLFEGSSTARSVVQSASVGGAVFEACLIINRGSGSSASTLSLYLGATLQNCTIVTPSDLTDPSDAIFTSYPDGSSVFRNNVVCGTSGIGTIGTPGTCSNNYTNAGSPPTGFTSITYNTTASSGNTGFENVTDGTHDFRIKASSGLQGNGTATGAPSTDIVGTTYASPPSVGAYEVAGGGGSSSYTFTPSGSVVFSGTALLLRGRVYAPAGSLAFSGNTNLIRGRVFLPSGSIAFSGAPTIAHGKVFQPSGQIVFSGSAPFSTLNSYVFVPSGSLVFSGTLLLVRGKAFVPSGSISFTGTNTLVRGKVLQPSGQITFQGGISHLTRGKVYVPSGAINFSGSAPLIFIPAGGVIAAAVNRISLFVSRAMRLS